jgi:hypothetical protein
MKIQNSNLFFVNCYSLKVYAILLTIYCNVVVADLKLFNLKSYFLKLAFYIVAGFYKLNSCVL